MYNDAAVNVAGAPSGSIFTWTSSNTQIAYPVNNAASTPIAVVGNGQVSFTLTVTNPCYNTRTIIIEYLAEMPWVSATISNYIPYPEPSCYDINGIYFFQATSTATNNLTDFQWGYRLVGSTTNTFVSSTSYIAQYIFPQPGNYEVFVRPVTACGLGVESTKSIQVTGDCSSGFRYMSNVELFPNPAKNQVTVHLTKSKEAKTYNQLLDLKEIKVFDKRGRIIRIFKYPQNTESINIDVSMFSSDVYYVEISDGKNKTILTLSIQK